MMTKRQFRMTFNDGTIGDWYDYDGSPTPPAWVVGVDFDFRDKPEPPAEWEVGKQYRRPFPRHSSPLTCLAVSDEGHALLQWPWSDISLISRGLAARTAEQRAMYEEVHQ